METEKAALCWITAKKVAEEMNDKKLLEHFANIEAMVNETLKSKFDI